ncbi:MAG: CsgG/HfaB family protein, partial [Spirochaetaceae bacterium]|nr:CsgG/HfaB family protein [Spirochaetaceae bacterium]
MKKLTCVCIGLVMAAAGGFGQTPEPSKRALPAVPPGPQPLDTVIQYAGQSLEARMKRGAKIAVLNFASSSEDFSDYAVEELIGVMVMGQWFTIVDRRSLDLIRKEMNLQLSGDVSDESAQAIGRQLGAEAIISGSLTNLGTAYRFRIKAINVETAVIEAQFAFTVQNDAQTAYLLTGKMPEPAPAPAPTPAPPAASAGLQAGLYGDSAFIGAMSLTDALTWAARNARPNGNYVIVLGQNEAVPPISLTYNNQNITITLKALGGQKEITFNTRAPAVPMFTVFQGASLIIEENVVLTGLSS